MIRALSALAFSTLLAGCASANDVCKYLGDYVGTFDGDASGSVTLTISEGEDGDTIAEVTLENDVFSALGNGTVDCEDGELVISLYDNDGNDLGTVTGSMIDKAGEWELNTGESGTWMVE